MGRKKKQIDLEEAIGESKEAEHRTNSELTDDEKRALLIQHKSAYSAALAVKKEADAQFKNICKKAKAECGKDAVAEIKDALALEEPGGRAALEAEIARKHRVARWMGLPVGAEPIMFEEVDRRQSIDIAYDQGKAAGMAGVTAQPPHDPSVPQYQRWLEGWHDGQEILTSAFKKLEPMEAPTSENDMPLPAEQQPEQPAAA